MNYYDTKDYKLKKCQYCDGDGYKEEQVINYALLALGIPIFETKRETCYRCKGKGKIK